MKHCHLHNTNLVCRVFILTIFAQTLLAEMQSDFRVLPYLQNPSHNGMTIIWFTQDSVQGELTYRKGVFSKKVFSRPELAEALNYNVVEDSIFYIGNAPAAPYRHQIRLTGLKPGTDYCYSVKQGNSVFTGIFSTAPLSKSAVRFIIFADTETEPESTGKCARWDDPNSPGSGRYYLIDQSLGLQNNLKVIQASKPDLLIIAGDLVQVGAEQRDWDEFWKHFAGSADQPGLAGRVPVLAALGNHDLYNNLSGYSLDKPGPGIPVEKFLTYFDNPHNNSTNPKQTERYYRVDYGPATIIVLDLNNNGKNQSNEDTNYYLFGESDSVSGIIPDFKPGSHQYKWLENQLIDARRRSVFTFIAAHHAPYSTGPHGNVPGREKGQDPISGIPVRILTPLFMQYGVDAVFSGHDEMLERSEIKGIEIRPDGTKTEHVIQFFDTGIAGDGLRAPLEEIQNPFQKFHYHKNSSEIWEDSVLIDGGKHYGHLEVDIVPTGYLEWQATLTPVYVFPVFDKTTKTYKNYERRTYNDIVIILKQSSIK